MTLKKPCPCKDCKFRTIRKVHEYPCKDCSVENWNKFEKAIKKEKVFEFTLSDVEKIKGEI